MRNILSLLFAIYTCLIPVHAAQANMDAYMPKKVGKADLVGQGLYSFMFWDLYIARLYAPDGELHKNKAFALELEYLRNLSGRKIADKSIEEIRKQGFNDEVRLADWHNQIQAIFPDVENGDILTGVSSPMGETIFYQNGTEIGRVKDPEFTKCFFDIWLSDKTSAPELRMSLLGAS